MRRRLVALLCVFVFFPLWIPALLALFGHLLEEVIEWAVNGRWLSVKLGHIVARIEYRLLPDHGGWKKQQIDTWMDDEGED